MNCKSCWFYVITFILTLSLNAQQDTLVLNHSIQQKAQVEEKDLKDVISKKKKKLASDSSLSTKKEQRYLVTVVPAAGYTLQTGFAALISANIGYYNDHGKDAKLSTINTSITYSQYNQIILPLIANIWTKGERYNIISDNRYISYPSNIFGLGGPTDPNKDHTINFNQIKLHETIVKRIYKNFYIGLGYYYDKFWDIKVTSPQTRMINVYLQKIFGNSQTASGPIVKALYDSRTNQINANKGFYLNVVLRQNLIELGSDDTWASLLIDARKYINFPNGSKNTLALWSFNWLTPAGDPDYLLLPSTGWDDQYNTGRGYVQSRFRGKQMMYFESEYRYRISRNGLIGGTIFGNLQHFTGNAKPYDDLLPGYGAGLRIKLNKKSNTNLCLDYGFGNNSQGFYINLGEVF
jgi:hypothetical protein